MKTTAISWLHEEKEGGNLKKTWLRDMRQKRRKSIVIRGRNAKTKNPKSKE